MTVILAALTFVHLWTHVEPGWMLAIPTIGDGLVFEGTTRGDVLALDERNGEVRWRASLGANSDETYGNPRGVISSIAVTGSRLYAVSGSCEAAALDARSGAIIWKRRICSTARNDDTYASPVVADGRVLFGIDVIADRPTDAGRVVAMDVGSGVPAWSFSPLRYRGTGGGISATPAVDATRWPRPDSDSRPPSALADSRLRELRRRPASAGPGLDRFLPRPARSRLP